MRKDTCESYISVCVIEKNAFIRTGLKSFLEKDCYKVYAELQNVQDLIRLEKNKVAEGGCLCDVCLLGISPGEDAKMVERDLLTVKEHLPDVHIIILSSRLDEELIFAFSKNADGYILNDISAEALMRSIDLVMLGEKIFPTAMVDIISRTRQPWEKRRRSMQPESNSGLSKREIQVLNCLVNGDSNKVIANNLSITDATVKVHLKAILRKLSVSNRTQAALWAVNNIHQSSTGTYSDME